MQRERERERCRGREGERKRGRDGERELFAHRQYKYYGIVLVVNIYYKLWKERHRTHMDNGWKMHNSFTSRRRRSNNIRNDFKALPRNT